MIICSGDFFWAKVWELIVNVGIIVGFLALLFWVASSNDRQYHSGEWTSTISLEKKINQNNFSMEDYDD